MLVTEGCVVSGREGRAGSMLLLSALIQSCNLCWRLSALKPAILTSTEVGAGREYVQAYAYEGYTKQAVSAGRDTVKTFEG